MDFFAKNQENHAIQPFFNESEGGDMQQSPALAMFERVKEESFQYYDRLARVRIFVEEKGSEPITLTEAAQVAAMETTYFSAFFKERVGISFTDWLRRVRIAKAMEIIREKDCRICDVAFAVGFGDVGTFSRAFKRYANQTPQDFKRSSRP